jgi:hypothetical protein
MNEGKQLARPALRMLNQIHELTWRIEDIVTMCVVAVEDFRRPFTIDIEIAASNDPIIYDRLLDTGSGPYKHESKYTC